MKRRRESCLVEWRIPIYPCGHTVKGVLPGNSQRREPVFPVHLVETPSSGHDVAPFFTGGIMDPADYRSTLSQLHTSQVGRHVAARPHNPVLLAQPPGISKSISRLPRQTQRVLSQLRSGFSTKLASYRHRVGQAASPLCPDCLLVDQTSRHLFECSASPTSLSAIDF